VAATRVGVIQMCSSDDLAANLAAARALVAEAAGRGCVFIALPENFAFLRREGNPIPCAQGLDGEIVETVRELASRHRVPILAGTFAEVIESDPRVYNTSALISETGEIAAVYRKIHLFDVDLGESGGGVFRESAFTSPGEEVVVAETAFGKVGLSVCYDVRFPELYREMASRGADWITVPSAFAPETGKVHWEVLLRARAIENQAFVLAPAQCGRHSPDRASHGRSLIIDPWGQILAEGADEPAVVFADCDPDALKRVRACLPALLHRRL